DLTESENAIIEKSLPFTMTGKDRLISLIRAIDYLVDAKISGDMIECGVWKGGSMMAVAYQLLKHNDIRDLYLYDTFEGMTLPGDEDVSVDKISAGTLYEAKPDWCKATIEEVERNLANTQYPMSKIHLVRGKVEDTVPGSNHQRIALLRLDTDWYNSTRVELEHLYDKIERGGVLIIDDYGHWAGARKATDEFFENRKIKMLLHRVDYTCRIGVKL